MSTAAAPCCGTLRCLQVGLPASCVRLRWHTAAPPHAYCFDSAGGEEAVEMAAAEERLLQQLGWEGQGLIEAAGAADPHDGEPGGGDAGSRGV